MDDKTVSKGMVKYASAIPRESIIDISGEVDVPKEPIAACTCSQVHTANAMLPRPAPEHRASLRLSYSIRHAPYKYMLRSYVSKHQKQG